MKLTYNYVFVRCMCLKKCAQEILPGPGDFYRPLRNTFKIQYLLTAEPFNKLYFHLSVVIQYYLASFESFFLSSLLPFLMHFLKFIIGDC